MATLDKGGNRLMSGQKNILDQGFILIVDDTGAIQTGSSGTNAFLGMKARNLIGTNLIDRLSDQSKFLLTEIIVSAVTGDDLVPQPAFLYTSSGVVKGFEVKGKALDNALEDFDIYDDEKTFADIDASVKYSLKFAYDDNLTKSISPIRHKDGFTKGVADIVRNTDQVLDMTFVSIGDVNEFTNIDGLSEEKQKEFIDRVEARLEEESLEGATSCALEDGKYALIRKSDSDFEKVETEIKDWALEIDPQEQAIKVQSKSIELDSDELGDRELRNAIDYATDVFVEGNIDDLIFDTLSESSIAYLDYATDRKKLLVGALDQQQLTAAYNAVVEMKTWSCDHLWAKVRADFEFDGLGTTEILRLIEDDPVLQTRVDHDQCRIIEGIDWLHGHSISLNFHLQSLDNIDIIEKLLHIRKSMGKGKLILRIFGVNERNITRLNALKTLQLAGLTLGLYGDELGAIGPDLLRNLPIDFIIVEFDYTRNPESLRMAMPMLRSLQKLCHDNAIKLLFNSIEHHDIATILAELDDIVATGRYFGDAVESPDQLKYKVMAPVVVKDPSVVKEPSVVKDPPKEVLIDF